MKTRSRRSAGTTKLRRPPVCPPLKAGGRQGAPDTRERASDTRQGAWEWGAARLRAAGLTGPDARLEAEVLLRHAARLTREELFARPEDPLPAGAAAAFAALIAQREAGRPAAYLVGRREFFGAEFTVDERVLIPRPETERLVEVAWDSLADHPAPVIVEVGTGSGAVAVTLARLLSRARLIATDCSEGALVVARENAARQQVADRITWLLGDGLSPLTGRGLEDAVDAVVSNPPYVPTPDLAALPREVREHEPRVALDGGPDGLSVHRHIIAEAERYLCRRGTLALEVTALGGQARAVAGLIAHQGGFAPARIVRDYAGLDRVVVATRIAEA